MLSLVKLSRINAVVDAAEDDEDVEREEGGELDREMLEFEKLRDRRPVRG